MKSCMLIAGTRPNFVKIAPLYKAFLSSGITPTLIHTGQHFDANMSDVFFRDLELSAPDEHLKIDSRDRITQTKEIVGGLTPLIAKYNPDVIVTVGDVTSTIAATIAAINCGKPVIHVEAGLRSNNLSMPEEVNRIFVDHYSDVLFATEQSGVNNLIVEGIGAARIHLVGNVMIDSLVAMMPRIEKSDIRSRLHLEAKSYAVATIHRPQNVDTPESLQRCVNLLTKISENITVVFSIHPRTKLNLEKMMIVFPETVKCVEPLAYCDMIALIKDASCVLTDSGGIQEETTALGVPCITMREETERPITVSEGTNEIVGTDEGHVFDAVQRVIRGEWKKGAIPSLWDGHAAQRIVQILKNTY